jgi:hypothetical protein
MGDNRNIYQDKYWCLDDSHDKTDVIFYNDGDHHVCYKHHYRCKKCRKIVQIG